MLNNFCYDKCPTNFFPTVENVTQRANDSSQASESRTGDAETVIQVPVCEQCHTFCTLCRGPAPTDCLACANGFDLNATTHTCARKEPLEPHKESILPLLSTGMAIGVVMALIISVGVFTILQIRDHQVCCWRATVQGNYDVATVGTQKKALLETDSDDSGEEDYQDTQLKLEGMEEGRLPANDKLEGDE